MSTKYNVVGEYTDQIGFRDKYEMYFVIDLTGIEEVEYSSLTDPGYDEVEKTGYDIDYYYLIDMETGEEIDDSELYDIYRQEIENAIDAEYRSLCECDVEWERV